MDEPARGLHRVVATGGRAGARVRPHLRAIAERGDARSRPGERQTSGPWVGARCDADRRAGVCGFVARCGGAESAGAPGHVRRWQQLAPGAARWAFGVSTARQGGDFVFSTPSGRYSLGPRGEIARDPATPEAPISSATANNALASQPVLSPVNRLLGRRPLRAAVEDGWPVALSDGSAGAVVAHAGSLYRVRLRDGAVVESRAQAFGDGLAQCHAVVLGANFGFVCGHPSGGTVLYEFEAPFAVREFARFDEPRAVLPSGNGAVVVRGGCARDGAASGVDIDAFCFVSASGTEREVRLSRDVADGLTASSEVHPAMLRDGRPVFVVPPRGVLPGRLLIGRSGGFAQVPLSLDRRLRPQSAWLDGLEEREPGVLGGWVENGAMLMGIRIALTGGVELAGRGADVERAIVAGRYALEWGKSGRGSETVDGGVTWFPVEFPTTDLPRPMHEVIGCGPVGCAGGSWMRIGWGSIEKEPDLALASAPSPSRVQLMAPRGIALRCVETGEVSGPLLAHPVVYQSSDASPSAPSAPRHVVPRRLPIGRPHLPPQLPSPGTSPQAGGPPSAPVSPSAASTSSSSSPRPLGSDPSPAPRWHPFRGVTAPSLASSDIGLDAGTNPPMTIQSRIYAWGPKGSDWSRTGQWLARFDDRFQLGGVRSTSLGQVPWPDEDHAMEALGLGPTPSLSWTTILEPSGHAAVLVARKGVGRAELYGAAEGEPLALWHDVEGGVLPDPSSVVRLGSSWYFVGVGAAPTSFVSVYRVDGGVARRLARLPRIPLPAGEAPPRIVRRARSSGLGLFLLGAPTFGQAVRDWIVLPIDQETGETEEPVRLFGSDLEGAVPSLCQEEQDGWLIDTFLSLSPAIRVPQSASVNISSIETRLRIDTRQVCLEALAARGEGPCLHRASSRVRRPMPMRSCRCPWRSPTRRRADVGNFVAGPLSVAVQFARRVGLVGGKSPQNRGSL